MKKIYLLATVALAASCGTHSSKKNEPVERGLDLSAMDTSVRPQDDFYTFANGGWVKTAQIPADKSSWGSFAMLREKTDEDCLVLLGQLLKESYPQGSEGQQIKDLYETFLDWDKRNREGLSPLQGRLQAIDQIRSLADLQKYLEKTTPEGSNPICDWGVSADKKNSQMNAVYLGGFSLGMGRDYYQKESKSNSEALAKYQEYITTLFTLLKETQPQEKAKQLVDFERSVARLMLTNEEKRNPNSSYRPIYKMLGCIPIR